MVGGSNKNRNGLITNFLEVQKKLKAQPALALTAVFGTVIITLAYRNFRKEYGKSILLTPILLQVVLKDVIDEIKKWHCIKRVIEPLLFKSPYPSYYTDAELEILERILALFNENNEDNIILCKALNQDIIYTGYNGVVCYGRILDMLFFEAMMMWNKSALQLFFKYNLHNQIKIRIRKTGTCEYYSSLAACVACEMCNIERIQFMIDNGIQFKNNAQIEDFINDITINEMYDDGTLYRRKIEKEIMNQDKIVETTNINIDRYFRDFFIKGIRKTYFGINKYIKFALQHMTDLKNMNSYYTGVDINYFVHSECINDENFIESIKPLFVQNNAWYDDENKNLDLLKAIGHILYMHSNNKNLDDYFEAFFHYMRLLLSCGIEITNNEKIKQRIDLQQNIETPIKEKLYQGINEMTQEELDFRKQFLRFDDLKNRSALFNEILERTSQPAIWMIRVIQSAQEEFKHIDTLFSYCANHFYELLQKPMWEKQYIHYVDSWKHLLIFLSKDNLHILHKYKKIIGKCLVKIFEYAYYFPSHDKAKLESFLAYCLAKNNPEIPFPDFRQQGNSKQGNLGNIFHLYARSGPHHKALTKIIKQAKNKNQELLILRALTDSLKKNGLNTKHSTPIDIAREEAEFAIQENRNLDYESHQKTFCIMNDFVDYCHKKLSDYKKSPHVAYSPWEDKANKVIFLDKKSEYMLLT